MLTELRNKITSLIDFRHDTWLRFRYPSGITRRTLKLMEWLELSNDDQQASLNSASRVYNAVLTSLASGSLKTRNEKSTPLMLAAAKRYVGIVQDLILKEADPNYIDEEGETALSYALDLSMLNDDGIRIEEAGKIAHILVSAGAKLHYPGNNDYTPAADPIWFIATYASVDDFRKCLMRGINLEPQCEDRTLLSWMAQDINHYAHGLEKFALLLIFGADPNAADAGLTVLHQAIYAKSIPLIKLLVNRPNLDLEMRDEDGDTFLDCAEQMGDDEIIQILSNAMLRRQCPLATPRPVMCGKRSFDEDHGEDHGQGQITTRRRVGV